MRALVAVVVCALEDKLHRLSSGTARVGHGVGRNVAESARVARERILWTSTVHVDILEIMDGNWIYSLLSHIRALALLCSSRLTSSAGP